MPNPLSLGTPTNTVSITGTAIGTNTNANSSAASGAQTAPATTTDQTDTSAGITNDALEPTGDITTPASSPITPPTVQTSTIASEKTAANTQSMTNAAASGVTAPVNPAPITPPVVPPTTGSSPVTPVVPANNGTVTQSTLANGAVINYNQTAGTATDSNGNPLTYSSSLGTWVGSNGLPPTPNSSTAVTSLNPSLGSDGSLNPNDPNIQLTATQASQVAAYAGYAKNFDATTAQNIQGITAAYNSLIAEQNQSNASLQAAGRGAGLTSGLAAYSPQVYAGQIAALAGAGLAAIGALNVKMVTAIQAMQQAQVDNDTTEMNNQQKIYEDAVSQANTLSQQQFSQAQTILQNARDAKTAAINNASTALTTATTAAQNFAPFLFSQTQGMSAADAKTAIDKFASENNIDPSLLEGQVQSYGDTINQSMKSAMYSMIADHPDAGITAADLSSNNIAAAAMKVMSSTTFQQQTATQKATEIDDMASANMDSIQSNLMSSLGLGTGSGGTGVSTGTGSSGPADLSGVTSIAQVTNPIMAAAVTNVLNGDPSGLSQIGKGEADLYATAVAKKIAPSYYPQGTIVGSDGLKDTSATGQTSDALIAGSRMLDTISDVRTLLSDHGINQFAGAGTLQDLGKTIGVTSPDYVKLQSYIGQLTNDYDILIGGVRGGASSSLLNTTAQYVPNVNNLSQYNLSLLDGFEGGQNGDGGVVGMINTTLSATGDSLNRTIVATSANQSSDILGALNAGAQASKNPSYYTDPTNAQQLQDQLEYEGYSPYAVQSTFKANNIPYANE